MTEKYVLALDQGTTSSRAIVFDRAARIVSSAQKEITQIYPGPGLVEHDPEEIWASQLAVAREALHVASLIPKDIAAIGVTNQRETTILWDRRTGQPVGNAVVWQSRVSAGICDRLKAAGHESLFRERTGLLLDPYFSGTKVKYLLDSQQGLRERARRGEILFGTVDTWLIWRLTAGRIHATDVSNASRTLMFNIRTLDWDDELLQVLDVPRGMLPSVCGSSELYGWTDPQWFGGEIPIAGDVGDQQAALFGQACFLPGSAKNTYGTGCFLLLNTGDRPIESKNRLLTTVGWKIQDQVAYCLEGAIFMAGAVVQWLRDGLGLINHSQEIERLANAVSDSEGVYFVPAFVGLGAPHWDPYARGAILGLHRGTTAAHLARAAVEAIAFQTRDVLEAMEKDAGMALRELKVDGGAAVNNGLMQFQADVLGVRVRRPVVAETTALGAAYLTGLAVGYWADMDEIRINWALDREFEPVMDGDVRERKYGQWQEAVRRARGWAKD